MNLRSCLLCVIASAPLVAQQQGTERVVRASELLAALPVPKDAKAIDTFLLEQMQAAKVPGLAAAVVGRGEVLWVGAYGWADIEERRPVDRDTVFQVVSVSKTVTAYAIMQLVEQQALSLDADINEVLPFAVRNPGHPEVAITLRHLLTHTSGIRDNWGVLEGTWVKDGDFPQSLRDSLSDYLLPGGEHFDARKSFYGWAAGTKHDYSNVGIALAALVAECQAEMSFEQLCEQRVFQPLKMTAPSYRLGGLEEGASLAMPYGLKRRADRFERLGHHGYLDFPSGTLRISAPDLARLLLCFIGDGEVDGVRLLRAATVRAMRGIAFPDIAADQGLVWYFDEMGGVRMMGHDGSDPGVASSMYYCPEDGVGFLVLMNGEPRKRGVEARISRYLLDYARKL